MKVFWIDDNPSRKDNNAALRRCLTSKKDRSEFIDARVKFAAALRDFKKRKYVPDLVVVDHFLSNSSIKLIDVGSTVSEMIREEFPACPIIGVTSADVIGDIDLSKRLTYDGLYSADGLKASDYKAFIALAKEFKRVGAMKLTGDKDFPRLLKCPHDDERKLLTILPDSFRNKFNDPSLASQLWRWASEGLFRSPGFLFNREWSANYLGLTPTAFDRIEASFGEAKYTGVFSEAFESLWWPSALRTHLQKRFDKAVPQFPWEAGQLFPGITAKDRSRCYSCKEHSPETLGLIDEGNLTTWVPLHLRCSKAHPRFERRLFFEEIRVMS